MLRTLATKIVSFLLVLTVLAPFPYILVVPEYAFAQTTGGGSTTSSWGGAAASGAVNLAGCMAAGGLVIGGAAGALGLAGGLFAKAGDFLSGVFDDIFGNSAISDVLPEGIAPAGSIITEALPDISPVPIPGLGQEVPVKDKGVKSSLEAGNKQRAGQLGIEGSILKVQVGMATREDVFNCIAWAIAKMIWRQIAASIIDWINSGFNGSPAFVQNFDRFLLGIADSVAGQVIQGAGLGFLCSPFQLNIRIALAMRYAQRAPTCTLTQVIANINNFMQNFQQGGWGAWLQFTTAPQNNPYGGLLLGEATIALRTYNAQNQQSQQLAWGGGFLSLTKRNCKTVPVQVSVDGGPTLQPQMVQQCTSSIQTPGQLIGKKIGSTLDAPETTLLMADEMNEIIDALSQQLLLQALNGLFSLSQPSSYGDDYYRYATMTSSLASGDVGYADQGSFLTQAGTQLGIQTSIENDLSYSISLIDNATENYSTVRGCWVGKASASTSPSISEERRAAAGGVVAQYDSILASVKSKRTAYVQAQKQATSTVALLRSLIAQAQGANQSSLAVLTQDFYTKQIDGTFASQAQADQISSRALTLREEAQSAYHATFVDGERCRYFPGTAPENCPAITDPQCSNGILLSKGYDSNGCWLGFACGANTTQ